MKHNFISKYGREKPLRAIAFSMNEAFSVVIKDRMEYYNSPNPNIDNIGAVRNQIDEVKDIMVQNIVSLKILNVWLTHFDLILFVYFPRKKFLNVVKKLNFLLIKQIVSVNKHLNLKVQVGIYVVHFGGKVLGQLYA